MRKARYVFSILFVLLLSANSLGFAERSQMNEKKETETVKVLLKFLNGEELPRYLNGVVMTDKKNKYILLEVDNITDRGVYLNLSIFSPNNSNLFVNSYSLERMPFQGKAYALIYAGTPAMDTTDKEVILEYKIEKMMIK